MSNLKQVAVRIKVLHIISGLGDGGAEGVLFRLITNDLENDHSVISLSDLGKYGPLLINKKIEVVCLHMNNLRNIFRGLMRLVLIIKKGPYDLIQTWMYHADLLGGIAAVVAGNLKICWGIRNTTLVLGSSKQKTILVAKICAILSYVIPKKIICCANAAAEVHAQLGYSRDKMVVIPNGYQLDRFMPNEALRKAIRNELGVDESIFLIGIIGRFDLQEDHENLINALRELNEKKVNFHGVMVGNGVTSENKMLKIFLRNAGVQGKVSMLGSRNDIESVMNALDINILSSAYGEAFPNVLAEAMACGTPCISTDVGDSALIIRNDGWIVPPRNSHLLAEAMLLSIGIKRMSGEWGALKERARASVVSRFGIGIMVNSFNTVWREIIKHGYR